MDTKPIFQRIAARVRDWFSGAHDVTPPAAVVVTPLISQNGAKADNTIPVFDLDSRVVDDAAIVRTDGSSGSPLHAARYEHGLWQIAWTDGRLGVDPEPQSQLIHAQAALTLQTRIAPVRAELENAKATENARRLDHERAEADCEQAKTEHDSVSAQQRRDPAEFSRWMGWMYFCFAVVIMLADVPLSLLVAEALGIKLSVPRGNPRDLLNLLRYWNVSWEPWLVALGIAGLTVAFKLVIDRLYIRDDGSPKWESGTRAVVRIAVLVTAVAVTIYACYVMGNLRAIYTTPGHSSALREKRLLFTMLAVLFPVVAAYCLSMARVCHQNASRLELAAKRLASAAGFHRAAVEPYEAARATRIATAARLDAINSDNIDEMFLRELYTHAYERGWSVPETRHAAASLYERCERLMHRSLARIEQFDNGV